MTATKHWWRGWRTWQARRRKELRAAGFSLSEAGSIALNEARCRASIANVIGKPAAKALRLIVCQGGYYEPPQFLITNRVTRETRALLSDVPALLWPIERRL